MISVQIYRHEIPHAIGIVSRLCLQIGALFFQLGVVEIDFVAEYTDGTAADRPIMSVVTTQMQACVPESKTGIFAEAKVFGEAKYVYIIPQGDIEIGDLKYRRST